MTRRHLKSPRSPSGRSSHLTLVSKWSWSWWSIPTPFVNVNRPSHSEIQLSMVKAMCVVKGQGHIWPWKFKVKVMAKIKPDGHIWNLKFNRYICFSFHGNRTIFGWDIGNSILYLENARSNPMVTFEALGSIDMFAFRFMTIELFLAEI